MSYFLNSYVYSIHVQVSMYALAIGTVSKLFASHFGVIIVPEIVTDSPPLVGIAHLQSSLGGGQAIAG